MGCDGEQPKYEDERLLAYFTFNRWKTLFCCKKCQEVYVLIDNDKMDHVFWAFGIWRIVKIHRGNAKINIKFT